MQQFNDTDILWRTLAFFLLAGALTGGARALLVRTVYWIRPSLLKRVEARSNQRLSSHRAAKALDLAHDHVDPFAEHHTQAIGPLILLASLCPLVLVLRPLV